MEASATATTRATPALGVARRRWHEDAIKALLILAALISILTTTGIVISLARETIVFFQDVGIGAFLYFGGYLGGRGDTDINVNIMTPDIDLSPPGGGGNGVQ